MSEHNINHLGDIAKQILEVLRDFMKQIMEALNVLKRLPEMIANLRKDLVDGFKNLIQAQAEMEIYIRIAQLKSKKSLIVSENEAISDFEKQLKEDFEEIDKRYSKINGELEEECQKRIREIDQHLLEIPDKFPHDLYRTYQKELIPLFQDLIQDTNISYSQRLDAIKIATEKTSLVINKFLNVRNDFFKHVGQFEVPEKVENSKTYYLPVWVLELNKGKKGIINRTILPSKFLVEKEQGSNEKSEIIIEDGLKNMAFIQDEANIQNRIITNFIWENDENYKKKVAKNFDAFFEKVNLKKGSLTKKAVLKAILNSNLKTIK